MQDHVPPRGNLIDIEHKLCQVKGVKAAKVVVNDLNDVEEIHLIALPGKSASNLVRDVESKLLECSLPIDREKVTISEYDEHKELTEPLSRPEPPAKSGAKKIRLKLVDVQITRSSVNASVSVMLQVNGLSLCGEATGPASKHNSLRLVAEACISSLRRVVRSSYAFVLDDLRLVDLNGSKIVLIKLVQVGENGEQPRIGSAIVDKDIETAVAKAVLDAVNRQIYEVRFGR